MSDEVQNVADNTVDSAAMTILGMLPDDDFGETEAEGESTGEGSAEQETPSEDESTSPDPDEDFDQEALDALQGDEEEPESEDEEEDESEGETEEEDEPEALESDTFTVKVDGKEVEVTRAELMASYSRTASWTRKSQALSEERKAFQEESEAGRAERAQYAQGLAELSQRLQLTMPREPSSSDPKAWIEHQEAKKELERVEFERQNLHKRMEEDFNRERDQVVAEQADLLSGAIPEWADEKVATAEKAGLYNYAVGLGFSDEEVGGITDHRVILLLRDAMKYKGLLEKGSDLKGKAKNAPTLKPGKPKSRAKSSKVRKAQRSQRNRLRESGRVDDAASLIFDMLDD